MADSLAAALDYEKQPRWSFRDLIVLTLAAALLVTLRLHAFSLPLETDECNYAYIGSRLLAGDRLYVDVWDHQPPGVFALFAGVIAIFGDSPLVFRWMAMAFSLASLLLLYAIARRIGGRAAGITAAFLFALASSDPGAAGEGCNREIYMNTLILCAWWLALEPRNLIRVFLAGAALALASSLKTNVAIHWLFLCVVLVFALIRQQMSLSLKRAATVIVIFSLAPAILWSGTFFYFSMTNRWHEFIDAVFTFNLAYSDASQNILQRFGQWPRFGWRLK
ncbi:MAG: glycosyltransferase family 39 protein [Planctomycetes bacterium]|nr:glycosyltransferase family 39 protein [Planctomycetota bacterium]